VKKNTRLSAILIVFIALLVFFRPSYGWKLRGFLMPVARIQDNVALGLAAENQSLKAELAKLQNIKSQIPEKPPAFVRAMVYSRYPLNFKDEMLLSAGRNEGVALGSVVVFEGVLVGKISKVFDDMSLVQTIFDSRFQSAVRVGTAGVDALLKGGSLPEIDLIPLKAKIESGDIVYTVSPDFPYGLPVGEVESIKVSANQLFQEATLSFAYDINAVETVLVAKK
jgi:rod shape-determining protein MreC